MFNEMLDESIEETGRMGRKGKGKAKDKHDKLLTILYTSLII